MTNLLISLGIFFDSSFTPGMKIWLQERKSKDLLEGLLEFPGGKVEKEELLVDALIREIQEEVGVDISEKKVKYFKEYKYSYAEKSVSLNCFLIDSLEVNKEGIWLEVKNEKDLDNLKDKIPPANELIFKELFSKVHSLSVEDRNLVLWS